MDTVRKGRTLADDVAETALDILRECGPKYWRLADGTQTRVTWEGADEVTLEHTETGHAATFVLEVRARSPRHAMTRDMVDLVRAVVDAARDLVMTPDSSPGPQAEHKAALRAAVSDLDESLLDDPVEPPSWRQGTWADVKPGDRVRLGTAEADVESVMPLTWLGSGARQIQVKLAGRQLYSMPPSGQVEILSREVGTPALPDWAEIWRLLAESFGEVTPHR
jgi:hypothetical protein